MRKHLVWILPLTAVLVVGVYISIRRAPRSLPPAPQGSPASVRHGLVPSPAVRPPVAMMPPSVLDLMEENDRDKQQRRMHEIPMSADASIVVGLNPGKRDYASRAEAMRALTDELSPEDSEALLIFLNSLASAQTELRLRELNGIKNNVLDVILRQKASPAGLGNYLVAMAGDDGHDEVWREYCIQYLGAYHERRWPEGNVAAGDSEHVAITNALARAAAAGDSALAGAALIGIHALGEKAGFAPDYIATAALSIACDESASEASRITAFLMCGEVQAVAIRDAARVTAQSGATTGLRAAAVAALGNVGEARDVELLESLTGSDEPRIKSMAAVALGRLKARLGS